ncbi:MAG: hypothetical protein JRC90_11140 [Deltaproteobacteria bacterium]|nr:hypothetical protein [Deltaproteobacteria bacterium]
MEGIWNFPLERRNRKGKLYFPTRALLPPWTTRAAQAEGERRFEIGEIRISRLTPKFDIEELGLTRSSLFPHLPAVLNSRDIRPLIEREAPVDNVEVVGWMHDSAADNAILTARIDEYNKYSQLAGACGDGYIPGVRVSDIHFSRTNGYTVASNRRGLLVSPAGRVSVPVGGGNTLITPDLLGWGGIKGTSGIQYMAQALKWIRLAETPITSSIGFPSFAGIVAPNFFLQKPDEEGKRARTILTMASDKSRRIPIVYRSSSDYTKVVDRTSLPLDSGVNEISFIVASYPSVPTVVLHVKPEPGTGLVLREYRVEVLE